jgi:hypothetical protein
VLAGCIFALQIKYAQYKRQLHNVRKYNRQLLTKIEDLKSSIDRYEELLKRKPGLEGWEIEELKRKGLKDPVKDIALDLMRHDELIPYEGVLGGKMGFYSEEGIWILTERWVLAYFEDGHIGGYMLLEYEVSSDGKISWRVIDSYLLRGEE